MSCPSTDCDLTFCYCRVRNAFPVAVIRPTDLRVEIRRGANAIAPLRDRQYLYSTEQHLT